MNINFDMNVTASFGSIPIGYVDDTTTIATILERAQKTIMNHPESPEFRGLHHGGKLKLFFGGELLQNTKQLHQLVAENFIHDLDSDFFYKSRIIILVPGSTT